ncbi:hypothetical protein SUDANB95_05823 [Actinosynnema sp. ALI-1.44]
MDLGRAITGLEAVERINDLSSPSELSVNGWPDAVPLSVLRPLPELEKLRLAWHTSPSVLDGIGEQLPDLAVLVLVGGVAADLAPVTRLERLHRLYLAQWVEEEPIDVRPLRDMSVTLDISRRDRFVGLDELGPGVEISYRR